MPWHIGKSSSSCPSSKPFSVIKNDDGHIQGCHKTREEAEKQLAALHASENKENERGEMDDEKDVVETKNKEIPSEEVLDVKSIGAISFSELEERQKAQEAAWKVMDLADTFTMLVRNIYSDNSIDSRSALNKVVGEFQQRVDKAMLSTSKEKKKVPKDLTELESNKDKPHDKDTNEFLVFKSDEGQWRWFAIYSNRYRDDDHPSEIISSKSHRAFVSLVDKGMVDYPELWNWHIKGTSWGRADWLAYADGFAMAAGYVSEGFEFVAKSLANFDGELRVSHGMPYSTIVRDKKDPSIILFHITKEISPLPGWAAANKWTGFTLLKEGDSMPIPDEKKEHLRTLGYSDEVIAQIEGGVEKASQTLDQAGVESKEKTKDAEGVDSSITTTVTSEASPAGETKVADTQKPAAVAEEPTAEGEPETNTTPSTTKVEGSEPEGKETNTASDKTDESKEDSFKKEVAEVITDVINPVITALNAQQEENNKLRKEITTMQSQIAELTKSDGEKIAETKEVTPVRSMNELVSQNIVGNQDARVHGNSKLAKDGPVEKENEEFPGLTPIPMLNGIMSKQSSSMTSLADNTNGSS